MPKTSRQFTSNMLEAVLEMVVDVFHVQVTVLVGVWLTWQQGEVR